LFSSASAGPCQRHAAADAGDRTAQRRRGTVQGQHCTANLRCRLDAAATLLPSIDRLQASFTQFGPRIRFQLRPVVSLTLMSLADLPDAHESCRPASRGCVPRSRRFVFLRFGIVSLFAFGVCNKPARANHNVSASRKEADARNAWYMIVEFVPSQGSAPDVQS
jgi:hypothetical protein